MKDEINLNKIAVGVDKIRNISKGGVVINCTSKESKEKLKNTVKKESGNKYQVIEPKPVNPKIIIVGTESEMIEKADKSVLESIISQNDLESIDGNIRSKVKVQWKFANKHKKNYGNVILEVQSDMYTKNNGIKENKYRMEKM
ncbi:hypothetical protein QE152_g34836 [Popillia japonica]|uniref:Uncharacterized protein n=1 Tax=Popillia japonica TaxID=7064 RepID=A0AAW1ISI4_POPJA